jgi:tellurite resistance protein
MDPEQIIGQLIGGFLGGKTRRSRGGFGLSTLGIGGRSGYGRSGGRLVNAGTLLTVGGLIWGALETMQQQGGATASSGNAAPPPPAGPAAASARGVASVGVPPLTVPPALPPIPGATPPPLEAGAPIPVPAALVPLLQLAVSAARADGELSDEEIAVIRVRAGELGAAALVDSELQQRRALETITPAFATPEQREIAYALAYAVVHGEGAVSAGERMYLTQLQRLLRLDHPDVERIERETLAAGGES